MPNTFSFFGDIQFKNRISERSFGEWPEYGSRGSKYRCSTICFTFLAYKKHDVAIRIAGTACKEPPDRTPDDPNNHCWVVQSARLRASHHSGSRKSGHPPVRPQHRSSEVPLVSEMPATFVFCCFISQATGDSMPLFVCLRVGLQNISM